MKDHDLHKKSIVVCLNHRLESEENDFVQEFNEPSSELPSDKRMLKVGKKKKSNSVLDV